MFGRDGGGGAKKMKVTFVLPYAGLAGGTKAISRLCEGLIERGHEVLVVSEPFQQPGLKTRLRQYKAALLSGNSLPRFVPEPNHIDWAGIPHVIRDNNLPVTDDDLPDADVVVATWWRTAEPVSKLSASKGVKAYFMQDYGAPGMTLEQIVPTWRLPLHLITMAEWLAQLIVEKVGQRQVDVTPCGVDLNLFSTRKHTRSKCQTPTIGFLYREHLVKGYDIVRDAFVEARRMVPNLRLLTYGPHTPNDLPLPDGMEFRLRPTENELPDIYGSCDAWLFASRGEGFGLPILESMACATPVIATPVGAASEIISHGGGVLCGHEDAEDMAKRIVELVRMPLEEWRELSTAARCTAEMYSWESTKQKFADSLERAVETRASTGPTPKATP